MKIVEPYAKMLAPLDPMDEHNSHGTGFTIDCGIAALRSIEYYARVSHRSEESMTATSYDRFIRSVVLQHGDWSVTEHEKVTVEMLVDRGITHEIVRHRVGSYTQESTRFVNYQKKGGEAVFVQPCIGLVRESDVTQHDTESLMHWINAMQVAERSYMRLLDQGVTPQIARSVLPNALASKIIVTYNLRSWRHFFLMRSSAEAHPQMRQIVDPLLAEFKLKIPILYEDIEPGRRQVENLKLPR